MQAMTLLSWWRQNPWELLPPLFLVLIMAGYDLKSRRIPNYLTFGGALAGLLWQVFFHGWSGLGQGTLGLLTGFGLLLLPYLLGGMGAGDVKALAALGAWLGPRQCFAVFCYMGLAGGVISLGVLLWRGLLKRYLHRGWLLLQRLVLLQGQAGWWQELAPGEETTAGVPYGVAIASGMLVLYFWGSFF